jgi:hypothetical protein
MGTWQQRFTEAMRTRKKRHNTDLWMHSTIVIMHNSHFKPMDYGSMVQNGQKMTLMLDISDRKLRLCSMEPIVP